MIDLSDLLYRDAHYCQRCAAKLTLTQDHEGKTRAVCSHCGFILYRNPIPAVACLVLNDAQELLLVKRKFEPAAGCWALSSGYMEIDQSPEENALAELYEETGLKGRIIRFVNWYFGFSPIYYRVLSLCFRIEITGGNLQAGDDAEEARFFTLESLPPVAFAAHRSFIFQETGIETRPGGE
jgi:ADP-ribose pyrophosphatase YjhB (NUDIX family)